MELGPLDKGEHRAFPGRSVQVQSTRLQIAAISLVDHWLHLILKPPLAASKIGKRQSDIALALIGSVIHRNQPTLIVWTQPPEGNKTIPGPVAFPGGNAFQRLPMTIAKPGLAQHFE